MARIIFWRLDLEVFDVILPSLDQEIDLVYSGQPPRVSKEFCHYLQFDFTVFDFDFVWVIQSFHH